MRKASLFLETFVENPLEQLWQLKIASNSYIKSVVLQLTSNANLSKFYEKIGAYYSTMLTDDDVVFIFVSGMGSNNKKSQFLII